MNQVIALTIVRGGEFHKGWAEVGAGNMDSSLELQF